MKTIEKHTKIFDDWFAQGNRLLKIGDTIFLPTIDYKDGNILIDVCDDVHTYSGYVSKPQFGELISEKRTKIFMDTNMSHISLHRFASNLIAYDSYRADLLTISILFSFDQIDTEQLPGWIIEELVRQKLSNQF